MEVGMIDWEQEWPRCWQRARHDLGIYGDPVDDTADQLRAQLELLQRIHLAVLIDNETLRHAALDAEFAAARYRAQAEAQQEWSN
jgi:hypothetical protein